MRADPAGAELLKTLADRQAIRDLLYRYCRAVDRIDAQLGYAVFHEDATADYGEDFYVGPARGLIDLICRQHRNAVCHTHQVTNILTELDGDRAASEAYVISALRFMRDGQLKQVTTWGRYLDQWERRDGRWGIAHRMAVRDLDEIADVTPLSGTSRGQRDRSDPSYDLLGRDPPTM